MEFLFTGVLLLYFSSTFSCLQILQWPALNCTQHGLNCTSEVTNCLDEDWLKPQIYTPSDPVNLEVDVDTREDEQGNLHPVLVSRWKAKDDGSIHFLKGTLLHVLMEATNQYVCVHYDFQNMIAMRNPAKEMWSFSLDRVVVDPGLSYMVSVSNLPKPNLYHSDYNVFKQVTVPDCIDPRIQMTKVCVDTGSMWSPNITLESSTGSPGPSVLTVGFNTDRQAQKYRVSLDCCHKSHGHEVNGGNQMLQSVQFDLDAWPQTCCNFDVEIQPFFNRCNNDCVRRKKTFNICGQITPTVPPTVCPSTLYMAITVTAVVISCALICLLVYKLRRRPKEEPVSTQVDALTHAFPRVPPRVLVIYSQDHPLYRKIVLKLCAFLRAKCGTDVVLDLLDTTWLGTVGKLPWLEWQRQQVSRPSDKILVLCSRGVQAKWQAMCGQRRVTLREDVRSPIDDMLTPALNLFLPDMHRAAALGKYMVAYFEDVSSESDVPSVFAIAVQYKLMKHFEELCFRILNQEKYAPGQVSHIEGIRADEYFNCQSGKELRDAIESFHAFQLENPDWFEQECVAGEEEEVGVEEMEYDTLLEQPTASVFECVPDVRNGPPVYACGVEVHDSPRGVQVLTAEVNLESTGRTVLELLPKVNTDSPEVCQSYPVMKPRSGETSGQISGLNPYALERLPWGLTELASDPHLARGNGRHLQDRRGPASCAPVEAQQEEEESYIPSSHQPSNEMLEQLMSLQLSLSGFIEDPGTGFTQNGYQSQHPVKNNPSIPVAMGQSQLPFRPAQETHFVSVENGCQTRPVVTDQSQLPFTSIQVTPPVSGSHHIQFLHPHPAGYSQPVEMEEGQLESPEKRPVSGSDQGYISRNSIQQDSPVEEITEDPLLELARLQQALYFN
ncbi:hypothetical protein DPEC_G00318820 [Dallia pectoralis]|uniref:Uncharacterized protein n=1 Tax=Dallia pectoralis TaxID=75939 RepID=A0ACC2F9D9_DALPE|nr:hypothetical protein DPEC_G00318820 [Dallia pectoralis]